MTNDWRGIGQGAPGWLAHVQIGGFTVGGGEVAVQVTTFFGCEAAAFVGCPVPAKLVNWVLVSRRKKETYQQVFALGGTGFKGSFKVRDRDGAVGAVGAGVGAIPLALRISSTYL